MLDLLKSMRMHQWTKNLLIFAALIFSKNLTHPDLILQAVLGFASFCLLSSAVYLFNDVMDADKDRLHPKKRSRPIAAGRLSKATAAAAAVFMGAGAFIVALALRNSTMFAFILGCYLTINVCYSFLLKKIVVADVVTLAIGFLLRIKAGGTAIGVTLSPWLILCTFFLASFLAVCKRRSELSLAEGAPGARDVLADYSFPILDVLVSMTASVSILTYALYTVADETVAAFGTAGIIYTLPAVMFGIGRYIFIVYRRKAGEDPAADILKDWGIILAVFLWLGIALAAVYGGMPFNLGA